MATFQVTQNTHNAHVDDPGVTLGPEEQTLHTESQYAPGGGYLGNNGSEVFDGGWIFRSTGIPPKAIIKTAKVTLQPSTNCNGNPRGNWRAYNVDSPTNFDTAHAHRLTSHATATTEFEFQTWASSVVAHTSPELKAVIQKVVSRPGFSGDLGIIFEALDTGTGWYNWIMYSETPGNAAVLTIVWEPPRLKTHQNLRHFEPDEGDFPSELQGKNWFRTPSGLMVPHGA